MAELIQIGNSKGIRIPKALIEQAKLDNQQLELKVVKQGLLICPVRQPREGWLEAVEVALAQQENLTDREWLEADLDSELDKL